VSFWRFPRFRIAGSCLGQDHLWAANECPLRVELHDLGGEGCGNDSIGQGVRIDFDVSELHLTEGWREQYMYAVVETGGKQYTVGKDDVIRVPKLEANVGDEIELSSVLLLSDGGSVSVGTPLVSQAKVVASVLAHGRGEKIIVFKMKRRKGFRRKKGHRQDYTELLISDIVSAGEPKAPPAEE